jgi:hypothetical protein
MEQSGQEFAAELVGSPIHRRRGKPDLQGITLDTADLVL